MASTIFILANLLFLFLPINCEGPNGESGDSVLTFESHKWEGKWEFNLPILNKYEGDFGFQSVSGTNFVMHCRSLSPVKWSVQGIIAPIDIIHMTGSLADSKTFSVSIAIEYNDAQNHSGLMTSATIRCEKTDDPTVTISASLFVVGKQPTLLTTKEVVKNSYLIPCISTDPFGALVRLFRWVNETKTLVNNVTYSPSKGFLSTIPFHGNYTCQMGSEQVGISALNTFGEDYELSPEQSYIALFKDEIAKISCISKRLGFIVRLDLDGIKDATISYILNTTLTVKVAISFPEKFRNDMQYGIACIMIEYGRERVIKEWYLGVLDPPELIAYGNPHPINYHGEIICQPTLDSGQHVTPDNFQILQCNNAPECHLRKHCIQDEKACKFLQKNIHLQTNLTSQCWKTSDRNCLELPHSFANGLAKCSFSGGLLSRTWEYFLSLDFRTYTNWKDAKARELVRMDEVSPILHANTTAQFSCLALAYFFYDKMIFRLEFKNGSSQILENSISINTRVQSSSRFASVDEIVESKSKFYDRKQRNVIGFNLLEIINISLPIEAIGVTCNAYWWNSSQVLSFTRRFETRYLFPPRIINETEESETFYIGDEHSRLTCFGSGEPEPVYHWMFKGGRDLEFIDALTVFPQLQISLGDKGEAYLDFPNVAQNHAGQYKCNVSNYLGNAEKIYVLEVSARQAFETASASLVVIQVFLCFIILTLAVALIIFWRRYKISLERHRNLTETEVQDFLEGHPELLSDLGGPLKQQEAIDFLPYNQNYEIGMDDIEIDQSDDRLLGSGEFSYVVKGKIISRSEVVAVKITKATVSTDLFKVLLSEVKIMLFVGDHVNIIGLVGVCTENVRKRQLYIITELCELGSLEGHLAENRAIFNDLMNSEQIIDQSLAVNARDIFCTLDLIYFAGQIANGMEYLAEKFVVHADLAARNILLTLNKTVKISDFGLSRKLYASNSYKRKLNNPIPWRWLPPESLSKMVYSIQSDVWSYGVVLYEIFTLGDKPFPNEHYGEDFILKLESGLRMGRPKYSTPEIYTKIVSCWETEPTNRPSFTSLKCYFEELLSKYDYKQYDTLNHPESLQNHRSTSSIPSQFNNL